jgi:hypothetical protein
MRDSVDVLVVGAGPVGLLLACELQRLGVDHLLVEKAPERAYFCKAMGVTPRTLEIFEALVVVDHAIDAGVWLNGMTAYRLSFGAPEAMSDIHEGLDPEAGVQPTLAQLVQVRIPNGSSDFSIEWTQDKQTRRTEAEAVAPSFLRFPLAQTASHRDGQKSRTSTTTRTITIEESCAFFWPIAKRSFRLVSLFPSPHRSSSSSFLASERCLLKTPFLR